MWKVEFWVNGQKFCQLGPTLQAEAETTVIADFRGLTVSSAKYVVR